MHQTEITQHDFHVINRAVSHLIWSGNQPFLQLVFLFNCEWTPEQNTFPPIQLHIPLLLPCKPNSFLFIYNYCHSLKLRYWDSTDTWQPDCSQMTMDNWHSSWWLSTLYTHQRHSV